MDQLETPTLILDEKRLDANIGKMREKLSRETMSLRPHLKTCKSLKVANKISLPGLESKITVSTLSEAEYFFEGGYTDILYAVSIVPQKLKRIKALQDAGATVTLILDTMVAAQQTAQMAQELETTFPCLIEIDSDGKRAGLAPDDEQIPNIAKYLDDVEGLIFSGVMTHAGGSYYCNNPAGIAIVAEQERSAITQAADIIRSKNISCPVVSMGSTPTAFFANSFEGITEIRAGVYVFQDMVMQALGVCETEDIAISVLTTVISHNPAHNRVLIDAGSLALSADPGKKNQFGKTHFGQICNVKGAKVLEGVFVTSTNQEHGLISLEGTNYSLADFPIGSRLRILPNHACITAAAYPGYHVLKQNSNEVSDYWLRSNGW